MNLELVLTIGMSFYLVLGLVMLNKKQFFKIGLVCICCGLILFEDYLWVSKSIESFPFLSELFTPLSFFIPVLLFFQSKFLSKKDIQKKWLYFIIPILGYLNFTPLYFSSIAYKKCYVEHEIFDAHLAHCANFINRSPVFIKEEFLDVLLILQFLILIIVLYQDLKTRNWNKNTSNKKFLFAKWNLLNFGLIVFIILCTALSMLFVPEQYSSKGIYVSAVGIALCFIFLKESVLLEGWNEESNYSTLSKEEINTTIKQLSKTLNTEEIYTSKALTLNTVAKQLDLSPNKLSFIINSQNTTFRQLVNEIRIKKAAEFLLSEEGKNYSIDGVAEKFGYKSKSTFYKNFKTVMSLTPKQYLKNCSN